MLGLIVAICSDLPSRGARWRSAGGAFAFEGSAAAVALDVHLQDSGVVDEPVDGGVVDNVLHNLLAQPVVL